MRLCRVIRAKGKDMRTMGFGLHGDLHLYPEETLFLVERCKLEVGNVTTPQLYEAVDLPHYLAYTYFKQTSLIVARAQPLLPPPGCQGPPVPPPPGIAFEAYAPTSKFSKNNPGRPIMYIMCGGYVRGRVCACGGNACVRACRRASPLASRPTRAADSSHPTPHGTHTTPTHTRAHSTRTPVPTEDELRRLFAWTGAVPLKYAMVSDEGGVFAVNLAPRPLENHTHVKEIKAQAARRREDAERRRKEKIPADAAAEAEEVVAVEGGGDGDGGGGW